MPPKLIQVGNDVVEFPEDMPDAQIQAILTNQSKKSSFLTGLGEPFTGAEQLAGKIIEAVSPSPEVKASNEALRLRQLAEEQQLEAARRLRGDEGIDWARLGGNLVNPLSLVPGITTERALMGAVTNPAVRAAIGGAVSSLTQPVTGQDYATEKAGQVALGTVAAPAMQKVFEGGARVLAPQIDASLKKLKDMGVTPTVGETLGGIAQSVEQFLEALPYVGNKVKAAKEDTFDDFRIGLINRAANKVDEKIPKGTPTYEAINKLLKIKDAKYDAALDGTTFSLDNPALTKISQTLQTQKFNTKEQEDLFNSILDNDFKSYFINGVKIDGQAFKEMESNLNKQIFAYKNSPNVSEKLVAQNLQDTLNTIKSVFHRQNPEKVTELRKVDSLYRDLVLIQEASARSKTGKFTPDNYNQAVKAASAGRKKRDFGTGRAYNQDIATAGVNVLGEPGSDLTRQITTGAVTGGAAGYGAYITDPVLLAAFMGAAPLAYTKSGKKLLDVALTKRPEAVRQVGEAIKLVSPELGLFGPEFARQYNISTRTK